MSQKRNTGMSFERRIQQVCRVYEQRGIATIEKIDPPSSSANIRGRRVHVLKRNPFLDFSGVWSKKRNRMLMFEAKSTQEKRLPFGSSGLRSNQIEAWRRWSDAGVICFCLWEHDLEVRMVTAPIINAAARAGRKSVKWSEAIKVESGISILFDFLATWESIHE